MDWRIREVVGWLTESTNKTSSLEIAMVGSSIDDELFDDDASELIGVRVFGSVDGSGETDAGVRIWFSGWFRRRC